VSIRRPTTTPRWPDVSALRTFAWELTSLAGLIPLAACVVWMIAHP
jgi:hypothetical protein